MIKVYIQTKYIEFVSIDHLSVIPAGSYFILENANTNYWTIKFYNSDTSIYDILNDKVTGIRATISKEDANKLLTMYDYIIWKNIPLKGGTDILKNVDVPMSKDDVLKKAKQELKIMKEKDELYIYKHYAKNQGKMSVKRLIKQGNRFIEGELLRLD